MKQASGKGIKALSPKREKTRLRRMMCIFFLCLSIPLALLVLHVREQFQKEMFYQYRLDSERLAEQLFSRIDELIEVEEKRPFGDYSFIQISDQPILRQKTVRYSPLSKLKDDTQFPGLIGYFQRNPDQSLQTPLLPKTNTSAPFEVHTSDIEQRLTKQNQVFDLLAANQLTGQLTKSNLQHDKREVKSFKNEKSAPTAGKSSRQPPRQQQYAKKSIKKLSELNLDASLWNKDDQLKYGDRDSESSSDLFDSLSISRSPVTKSKKRNRASRKEDVYVPAESSAKAYEQILSNSLPIEELRIEENLDELDEKKSLPNNQPLATRNTQTPLKVLSFEGEIDPLQFSVLKGGEFAFYRRVWRNNKPYIQGFLVSPEEFWQEILEGIVFPANFGQNITAHIVQDDLIIKELKAPITRVTSYYDRKTPPEVIENSTGKKHLLYQTTFRDPLSGLGFVVSATSIPLGPGTSFVNIIAVFVTAVLLVGLFLLYRVGLQQIRLAEDRSNFVSAVSHELKTPLTSIRMYGEMLRSNWVIDQSKARSYYDYIFFESERLSRLIENVLQLAKLNKESLSANLVERSPSELLSLQESKASSLIENAQFTLECERDEKAKDALVIVDEDLLVQITLNLVDNALKFAAKAEEKKIVIGYRLEGNASLVFYVRDFGPGVSKDQMKKIFQLFYRPGNELTRATPGTGIGLALVKELASLMNASVNLQNRAPGAEFQLKLQIR